MLKQSEKKLIHHLRRIKGQMEGLEKMVAKKGYCPDIMRLSLAIQKSLHSFDRIMLDNHLREHVAHQFAVGKERKAIQELLEIYSLSNK